MEARATYKYMRISPQKARLVVDLIRGKSVSEALSILDLHQKASDPRFGEDLAVGDRQCRAEV